MIRFFVYGIPALLLVAITASFVSVSSLAKVRKNEMAIGQGGEPVTLNPIKEADGVGAGVQGAIFNGLLTLDENLEVITDLATSYTLSQTSTWAFADAATAASALTALESNRTRWTDWNIASASLDGAMLIVRLTEPGLETSQTLTADVFAPFHPVMFHVLRVDLTSGARDAVTAFRTSPVGLSIVREWVESSAAFEFTVAGEWETTARELRLFFAARPDAKATVELADSVPFLAEPEVLFTLRTDVLWHDGHPFTSRDPAFTFHAIMDEAVGSPRKPDFDLILRVETPDPHTFRVIYRKPYAPALNSWMMSILPAHILEGKSQTWWAENFNRHPIGTGPFQFDVWKTNEYIRLVRNPDFYKKPSPWLDSLVFHSYGDQLAVRLAFETRQVDFWSVDPWAVKTFQNDPRFEIFSRPRSAYTYIGWNLARPIFQDERVRHALAHAVNIPEMIEFILYGRGSQSTGIFTPQMWFFNPNIQPLDYNPDKARALLAEAGWAPGPDGILTREGERFSFTLISNAGNEIRRDIATLVQDDLRSLGIEVKIALYEWSVFIKNFVNKRDFDAVVLGWSVPSTDFDQFQIWHSSQRDPEKLNMVGYANPTVDKLLENIRQQYRRDRVIAMAGEIQSMIYNDQPYLFLYVPDETEVIWRDSYRIRRPGPDGRWIDSPIEMTRAGWSYYLDWFYRPEYADLLPAETKP